MICGPVMKFTIALKGYKTVNQLSGHKIQKAKKV